MGVILKAYVTAVILLWVLCLVGLTFCLTCDKVETKAYDIILNAMLILLCLVCLGFIGLIVFAIWSLWNL